MTLPHNSCIRDNVDFRSSRRLLGVLKEGMSLSQVQIQFKSFFSSGSNPSEPLEASRYEKAGAKILRAFGMTENQGSGMTKEEYEFLNLEEKKILQKL